MELKGLATGIGSLPHKDTDEALDLIFKYTPDIPFWPQLPKRDIREGMVAQFSEGLPGVKVTQKGLFFDSADKEKELEGFYERVIGKDVEYFKISRDFAHGLYAFKDRLRKQELSRINCLKCQITGPFTFAASLKDENGISLLHDPVFMQAIIKGLAGKALWQIKCLEEFGKKIILFIDEPYLGCFGSAYTPINREDVVKGLAELTDEIKAGGAYTGVHCCGNTDWSIFTDIRELDIINFDAYGFLDKFTLYADNLKGFLEKGGIICWGIVPTQDSLNQETAQSLVERLEDGISRLVKKGIGRDLLLANLLISPSCGLATLGIGESAEIFRLLWETSAILRKSSPK